DERRDPWLSTDGALKKLKENYKQFKDWPLALAAYNCGAGAVSRALKKASEPTFSALCNENLIPLHAQVYVPNFLKVADMIINAEYYGDTELARASHTHHTESTPAGGDNARDTDDDYFFYTDFDYVTVNQSIDLNALALEMRLDPKILRELNLSLIKGVTPPGRAYKLRVPAGTALSCLEAINAINNYSKNAEK
ncbi:transglycosylase SLT domain-containing protein, partial [Treponema sp.]|uniref:transglycosylase SLT domain-containing protein n=1 Tax=Treponema sp. TaxID=166 RepID=UPI00298DBF0E